MMDTNTAVSTSSPQWDVPYISSIESSKSDPNTTAKTNWKQLAPKDKTRIYFHVMKSKNHDYEVLCESWIRTYEIDKVHGMNDLCQFFVDVAGYQHINVNSWLNDSTTDELNDTTMNSLVSTMEENQSAVLQNTGKYLLKIREKSFLQRHEKIAAYIEAIIKHSAEHKVLFGTHYILSQPIQLFERMSNSNLRPIKHAGIYFALKYQTALIYVHLIIKERIKTLKAQLKEEPENEIILIKIETWKIRKDFIYKKILKLNNIIGKNGCHGDPQLYGMRIDCISELGKWIDMEPDFYLNEGTYQFFSMTSYDYDKTVRKTLLEVLTHTIKNHHIQMNEKVKTLFEIIIKHINDPDLQNKIFAVECLIKLMKYQTIPSKCREKIYLNIFCIYSPLSVMCGKYLAEKIKANAKGDSVEELLMLLHFIIQYRQIHEDHYNASLLVDAVLKWMPWLEDISNYMKLLKKRDLEVEAKQPLIEIMTEVFYQIFTGRCRVVREQGPVVATDPDRINDLYYQLVTQIPFFLDFYVIDDLKPLLIVIKLGKEIVKAYPTKQ